RLVLVEDVLLQLLPVVVALGQDLAHEGVEIGLSQWRGDPGCGNHNSHESTKPRNHVDRVLFRVFAFSWLIHRASDVSQVLVVRSNRNASSMSARAFSSEAITVSKSVTESIPR